MAETTAKTVAAQGAGRHHISRFPPHPMDLDPVTTALCSSCGEGFEVSARPASCACGETTAWLSNLGRAAGATLAVRAWEVPNVRGDPEIAVCGCATVTAALAAARRAGRPFSGLLSWETPGIGPDGLSPRFTKGHLPRQLVLAADDVVDAGHPLAPRRHHVRAAMRFARGFRDARLLVNCHMGISRSVALAMAVLADRLGPGGEQEAVERVVAIRPVATPNRLILALADELLGRGGALVDAAARHPDISRRRAGYWP